MSEKMKRKIFSIRGFVSGIFVLIACYFINNVEKSPHYIRDLLFIVIPLLIISGIIEFIFYKIGEKYSETDDEDGNNDKE